MRCNGEVNAVILLSAGLQWVWLKGWCQWGFLRSLAWKQQLKKFIVIPVYEFTSIYFVTVNEESFAALGSHIGNFTTFHEISCITNCSCDATGLPVCKQSLPLSLSLQMVLEKVMEAGFLPYLLRWTSCPPWGWYSRCQVSHENSVISFFLAFSAYALFFWRCPAMRQALTIPALVAVWHSTNEPLGMIIILTELMRIRVENPNWIIHTLIYLYKWDVALWSASTSCFW